MDVRARSGCDCGLGRGGGVLNFSAARAVRRLTPAGREFFFGYYDKCPWNSSGGRLLVGETTIRGREPRAEDTLEIGWIGAGTGEHVCVGETKAWNFQQGAMAQWVASGPDERIVFNVLSGGSVVGTTVRSTGGGSRLLSFPVYAVSRNGKVAASVDFGRLSVLRPGYGYAGGAATGGVEGAPDGDGLTVYRMRDGARMFFVSLRSLAESIAPRGEGASHWVDHAEFAPDAKRLVFLHRWLGADGAALTRVMCADLVESKWHCLLDCGAAGHGVWLSNQTYGIWARLGRAAAVARSTTSAATAPVRLAVRMARRILPAGFKRRIHSEEFLAVNVDDGTVVPRLTSIPYADRSGHPSLHPSGQRVVTDTLPDRHGRRKLFLAALAGGESIPLGRFAHDPATANSPCRCDLHPRWDRLGSRVCFDSLHEGFRGVYEIDVPEGAS